MRVELRVEARRDLLDGAWFYEHQREGLGASFTDRLFDDLERLEGEAGIHEVVFGLHRKLSRRFPFAIYYRLASSVIDVVAVLDCRRDPESIAKRLAQELR
jgi:plasmid stabilization system protein ParE